MFDDVLTRTCPLRFCSAAAPSTEAGLELEEDGRESAMLRQIADSPGTGSAYGWNSGAVMLRHRDPGFNGMASISGVVVVVIIII